MFSNNILRFVKRSASVRPPLSFRFGVQNDDTSQKQNIKENHSSKRNSDFKDKNKFSNRKGKHTRTLTDYEVEKSKKDSNINKFTSVEMRSGRLNFASSDLMHLESTTKKRLPKSHKSKCSVGYEDDIVFGIHPVFLALQLNKRKIYEIFYKKGTEKVNKKIHEIIQMANEKEITVTASRKEEIDRIVGGDRVHQGVCCNASALPSVIIDDPVDIWRNDEDKSGLNEGKDYYPEPMTNSFDYNHILDDHFKPNNFLMDVKENESNSELTSSDLLKGKLKRRTEISTIEDASIDLTKNIQSFENNCRQVWIYLDSVHDPMNLGAILRSAYYMGIDKVIISKDNSCRISGVVSKASAGVAEIMQVYQVHDPNKLVMDLKDGGWCTVVATSSNDSRAVPVSSFTSTKNTLILIGNEGKGVKEDLCQLCDTAVTILPRKELHPAVDSLNVSVATALLLYTITNNINQ